MKKNIFLILNVVFSLLKNDIGAVPSFAENLGLDCSTCHTAYPQLTEFGKLFLEKAGDPLIQKEFGALTMTSEPVSGRITMVPIDKPFSIDSEEAIPRRDRELRIHGLEEADLFLAGRVGKFFYIVQAGAAIDNDFQVSVGEAFVAYRFSDNLNIFTGFSNPYKLDANDTVDHNNALFRQWKAADYVPGTSQVIGVNWKTGDFHWILGWHGNDDEFEGIDPKNVSFRGNYDFGHHSFGAYFSYGKRFDEDLGRSKDNFLLYGVDAHLRFTEMNIMMLLGFRNGHDRKMDFDFSIEANKIYTITNECTKKYLTTVIPIANIDFYMDRTLSSGTWIKGSAGVACYFNPSVRIFPQMIYTFLAPSEFKHREFTFLFVADMGF